MYKIAELYKIAKLKNQPLMGDLSVYDFMRDYDIEYPAIDRYFAKKFGSFSILGEYIDGDDALENFREDINALLHTTEQNYNRIFALTKLEYNPIDNYDRTEERSVEKLGSETRSNEYGESVTSVEQNTSAHTDNITLGESSVTKENSTSTYESDVYHPTDKSVENNGGSTNINEYGAVTGSNVTTENQHTDNETVSYNERKDIEKIRAHGNIGVTTTAQMISGEKELWSGFVFYNMIFNDILQNLCIYVEG